LQGAFFIVEDINASNKEHNQRIYFCFLYLIVMVYLHPAFSSQTKLLTKFPQCTETLGFPPSSQFMLQRQYVLGGYLSGQLGDCRVPEGPKTSPPQLGGIGVVVVVVVVIAH
jgi:hypothetical protein